MGVLMFRSIKQIKTCFGVVNVGDTVEIRSHQVAYLKSIYKNGVYICDMNINDILDAMEKALNKGIKPDLVMCGYLVKEMRSRQDLLLHPDLMFDLVALRYVREDEVPFEVDEMKHREKVIQFTKDSKEGLYNFFYEMGMSGYLPYITKLESDWNMLWEESRIKIEAMNQIVKNYTTK
jgi:hypothetical protein